MKLPTKIKLFCGLLCLLLTACGTTAPAVDASESFVGEDIILPSVEPEPIPEPEPEPIPEPEPDPIADLMATMTVEEKVGQLFFVRVPSEQQVEDVATYHLGGYILFGRDTADQTVDSLTATIASYQENATIPLLIGVDEEGGTVVRVSSNPNLMDSQYVAPPNSTSSRYLSPQALMSYGGYDMVGYDAMVKTQRLQSLGFNVNLAPVADVSTSASDFIYDRTLGKDATSTASYVREVVYQMDALSMGSVLKHFPGYGDNIDTHTGIAVDNRSLESFLETDFLPFQAGVDTAPTTTSILVSHNIITNLDGDYPASLSVSVHQWLRDELGFDGVVMTDDLAMDAVAAYAEDGNVSTLAILAGNDLVITSDYRTQIPKTLEAVENGTLPMERLDEACYRVLQWKQNLGLI